MYVLVIILVVLVFIILAIAKFKIHPFIILLLAAVMVGFLIGLEPQEILGTISQGFGNTLSSIGIIIAFGAIIGTFLEKSGGTKKIARDFITNGGRVLAITSMSEKYQEALKMSYNQIKSIGFDKMSYRKDIGFDL